MRNPDSGKSSTRPVESSAGMSITTFRNMPYRQRQHHHGDCQIDEEGPTPRTMLDQEAPKNRAHCPVMDVNPDHVPMALPRSRLANDEPIIARLPGTSSTPPIP